VRAPSARAKKRLIGVKEIVGIELAPSMLSDMGVVFAYELARYLAQKADGVIVDDDGTWQEIARGGFSPL